MKIHRFNTSRLYRKEGQRISVLIRDDGSVLFNDHDRMIWGEMKEKLTADPENYWDTSIDADTSEIAIWVMNRYDSRDYNMACCEDLRKLDFDKNAEYKKFRI